MIVLERILWVCGLAMVAFYAGQLAVQDSGRRDTVAAYRQAIAADAPERMPAASARRTALAGYESPMPDQSLWSPGRVAAFAASLGRTTGPVLGIFEMPRLGLELPIYDGASDLHMDRGIARIEGTAMPGPGGGNLGIAGHRDGYFRVLKDVRFGDEINVSTPEGTRTYVVEQLMIVDPSAVEVLGQTPRASITLVTCYPFYYVGHAPERFVVRAVLREES
jgi:LPXTG-site transpeptidase (sortase) family protein